jgi:hypothetical protein
MARGCAGPRETGKPLQMAVDAATGTTEATQPSRGGGFNPLLAAATVSHETMSDNEFPNENNVLPRATSMVERGENTNRPHRSKPVRSPKPFTVFQPIPGQNFPTLLFVIHAYLYLEVRCLGCDTRQTVALDIVRRPKTTPVHELERYMRCKDCSQVRGYPYKRSHLVALRATKITASDPPSTWWPGER